jgi:hypothetical protein
VLAHTVLRLRKFFITVNLALLALVLPQSTTPGQATQDQTQRFGAGWIDLPASYKFEHINRPDFDVDYLILNDEQLNKASTMLGLYWHCRFTPASIQGCQNPVRTFWVEESQVAHLENRG